MISKRQKDIIIKVMQPYSPVRISIFGSFATGNNTVDSDIDILYKFKEPISLFEKYDIKE